MIISLINHTNLPDMAVQQAIRAVNVQIEQDFYPYWSIGATLRLEGRIGENPDLENLAASLRGDAILYLEDTIDKKIRSDSTISISAAFRSDSCLRKSPARWASLGRSRCRTKRWS